MLVEIVMEEVEGVIDNEPPQQLQDEQTEVIRELRDLPPVHYLFKSENFSHLSNAKADNFESNDFEVGGCKWKLRVYPKGNKKSNENEHISVYLVLSKSNGFTLLKEVNAYFKLFAYNQIDDKYLTIQDSKWRIRRFRGTKTEWGFDQLIPLDVFNDASNGYLIDDCCIFGVEVFVLDPVCNGESTSVVKDLAANNIYNWNIQNFDVSALKSHSKVFVIGGRKWFLQIYPGGNCEEQGKSLSLFLHSEDSKNLKPGNSIYVELSLHMKDQLHWKHHEKSVSCHFSESAKNRGFRDFIPHSELNDSLEDL